jgi:hypothetical protein
MVTNLSAERLMQSSRTELEASGPYKTAAQAVTSLLHLIRKSGIRQTGRITPDFWHDPFVLGYLFHFIHRVAVQAGEDPNKYDDMPSVYTYICGRDGLEVLERTAVFSMNGDPDYQAGREAAEKFLGIIYGFKTYDDDPAVLQARSQAIEAVEDWDGPNRPDLQNMTFAYLLETIFLAKIRQRLDAPHNRA